MATQTGVQATGFRDPLQVYHEMLLPLMSSKGFVFTDGEVDPKRIQARFTYERTVLDKHLGSQTFNQKRTFERSVEVFGIPTATNLLLLHGTAFNPDVKTSEVRAKVRCNVEPEEVEAALREKFVNVLLSMVSCHIGEFPKELKLKLLGLMTPASLMTMALVSKEWYTLSKDDLVWKCLLEEQFPKVFASRQPGELSPRQPIVLYHRC